MRPAAMDFGRWQAIFSQESWRISRKNCAVQGAKAPPVGHVDMFQTSPSQFCDILYLFIGRFKILYRSVWIGCAQAGGSHNRFFIYITVGFCPDIYDSGLGTRGCSSAHEKSAQTAKTVCALFGAEREPAPSRLAGAGRFSPGASGRAGLPGSGRSPGAGSGSPPPSRRAGRFL